jgi:hypothetical protein
MVLLCLAFAGCPATVTVPSVVGKTQAAATTDILAAKLVVGQITTQASETVAVGCVISQNPAAGASASSGAAVSLVISLGTVPEVAWHYQPAGAGVWGQGIAQAQDGGYVVSGGDTLYSMYALKLNALGQKTWEYTYSNLAPNNAELWRHVSSDIQPTADGGFLMLGSGHSYNDGFPDRSYVFVKLTAAGLVSSSTVYAPLNPYSPGNFCSETVPGALDMTSDGGYVAFGSSYCGGYDLASIYKANSSGVMQFGKVINDNNRTYDQQILDGQQTSDGGYILAGYSENGFPSGYGALLIKLNSSGNLVWHQAYQDVLGDHGADAYCVTETSDGGYVIAGDRWNSLTKALNHGPFMAKYTSTGNPVWACTYSSANTAADVHCLKETPDGELLAVGQMSGKLTLSKYNSNGGLLWNFKMENLTSCRGKDFVLTGDGGCVILGSSPAGGPTLIVKVNNVYTP